MLLSDPHLIKKKLQSESIFSSVVGSDPDPNIQLSSINFITIYCKGKLRGVLRLDPNLWVGSESRFLDVWIWIRSIWTRVRNPAVNACARKGGGGAKEPRAAILSRERTLNCYEVLCIHFNSFLAILAVIKLRDKGIECGYPE